ncbi:MAG: glycosyltransferase, partial [Nitrososphaera sp.]|nr:glycosyltransferase [Nitrososphaera sp.]
MLVVTKRQYMSRDLLDDRFGRFRELPLALSRKGHQVRGICLSYQYRPEGETRDYDASSDAQVAWRSLNAGNLKLFGLMRFIRAANAMVQEFQPNVVWACSDSFYGVIGNSIAQRNNTRCVFDLYDNFESFASTSIPGVWPLYRRAACNTDGLTCTSKALAAKVINEYGRTKPTRVLVNGICSDIFMRADREQCRRDLNLPKDARIVGTAGALFRNRGIDTLFRAFEELKANDARIHLAIAGPRDRFTKLPVGPNVHDF